MPSGTHDSNRTETTAKTSSQSAMSPLFALARILARQAVRELVGEREALAAPSDEEKDGNADT